MFPLLGTAVNVVVCSAALYVILKPVNRILALIGALFRLVFACVIRPLATLNLLGRATTARNRTLPSSIPTRRRASLGQAADRGEFRRLLYRSAIFWIGCDHLRVPMVQVGIHSKNAGYFGVISSAWCVICAFIFLVFPNFNKVVNDYWFDSPMAIFELVVGLWLLFKGLQPPE